ncbi:unnamed protein product [Ilex paraguariensis]|uniref:Uncharacterized protein n=1 Tax=Ilex paraguariensis TaxID=185542 RepID=A0ABC8T7J8_9AQUA
MSEGQRFQLGTIGALSLSVVSSVSIVICNKALISTLGFTFAFSYSGDELSVIFPFNGFEHGLMVTIWHLIELILSVLKKLRSLFHLFLSTSCWRLSIPQCESDDIQYVDRSTIKVSQHGEKVPDAATP